MKTYETNQEALSDTLEEIMYHGTDVGPKGLKTKELTEPLVFRIRNIRKRLTASKHLRINPLYPYIEGMWILLGEDSPDRLINYSKFPMQFVNSKYNRLDGAYGPRIRAACPVERSEFGGDPAIDQLDLIYNRLKEDRNTRRAVITISSPLYDWNSSSLDIPCTQAFQFLIRNGGLDMITTMRSQDIVKGLPNDLAEFQWIQEIVSGWLNVAPGTYTHFVGSAHIYETDFKLAYEYMKNESNFTFLYCNREPLDCRVNKLFFNHILSLLGVAETKLQLDPNNFFSMLKKFDVVKWPEFYQRLFRVIAANSYYKKGYLNDAKRLVEDAVTDLEYFFNERWSQ